MVVVDNMISGYSLHRLSDGAYIRGYPTQVSGRSFIKAVGFVENFTVVVGESDHGVVYLFDRDSGVAVDTLRHADRGLVQIVAVSTVLVESGKELTHLTRHISKKRVI
jgi:hypothetical protein